MVVPLIKILTDLCLSMQNIRVVLFDDNARIRDSISMLFSGLAGIEFAGTYEDCFNLEQKILTSRPDVILMDIDIPGIDGIQAVTEIHSLFPEIKILMQTVFDDSDKIFRSLCAGAHGYLLKNTPPLKMIEAVQEVYQGGAPMTPVIANKVLKLLTSREAFETDEEVHDYQLSLREKEVLKLLVQGKSYKMIAADLFITYDTVRAHIKKIYEKLHVGSMTEAVSKAIKHRIV